MTLLEEIQSKCSAELIASHDYGAIAAIVNVGRTKVTQRLGGIGLVLETLGPEGGATLLDALQGQTATVPALKWAWYLIERGELDFGSAATRGMINALITEPAKSLLLAVAEVADPVSVSDVQGALDGVLPLPEGYAYSIKSKSKDDGNGNINVAVEIRGPGGEVYTRTIFSSDLTDDRIHIWVQKIVRILIGRDAAFDLITVAP